MCETMNNRTFEDQLNEQLPAPNTPPPKAAMWTEISAQIKPAKTPFWDHRWLMAACAGMVVAIGLSLYWVGDGPLDSPSDGALNIVQQLRPDLYQRTLPALEALDEAIEDVEQRLAGRSNERLESQLARYVVWRQQMVENLLEVATADVG